MSFLDGFQVSRRSHVNNVFRYEVVFIFHVRVRLEFNFFGGGMGSVFGALKVHGPFGVRYFPG